MGALSRSLSVDEANAAFPERLAAALRWVFLEMETEAGLRSSHGQCIEAIARRRAARVQKQTDEGSRWPEREEHLRDHGPSLQEERDAMRRDDDTSRSHGRFRPELHDESISAIEAWACWSTHARRGDGMRAYQALCTLEGRLVAVLFALHGPRRPGPPLPAALGDVASVCALLTRDPRWREEVQPARHAGEDKAMFERRAARGRQLASAQKKQAAEWVRAAHDAFARAWELEGGR